MEFNEPFRKISSEEELVVAHFRKPNRNESYKLMNATMIAKYLAGGHLSNNISATKIGMIMRQKKFFSEIKHKSTFYRVVEVCYQDQQRYLLDMLKQSENENVQLFDNQENELPF